MEFTKEELRRKIEEERQRLHALLGKGLDDPEVQESSRKLDELIAQYYQLDKQDKTNQQKSQG